MVIMNPNDDMLHDFDDDAPELGALQNPLLNPLTARRSLERLLERRALKSRLHDELAERQPVEDFDWY
jgi:hypothetical protein